MLRYKVLYIIWIVSISILHYYVRNLGTWSILTISIIVPAIFCLLSYISSKRVFFGFHVSETVVRGDMMRASLRVYNPAPFMVSSIHFSIMKRHSLSDSSKEIPCNMSLRSKSCLDIDLSEKAEHSGVQSFSIQKAYISDPFYLMNWPVKNLDFTNCVVVPKVFDISVRLLDNANQMSQDSSMSQPVQEISEAFDLREYHPGDPVKNIHWKLSEKKDTTIVREAGMTVNNDILILFTNCIGAKRYRIKANSIDTMLDAFASVSKALFKMGHTISIGIIDPSSLLYEQIDGVSDDNFPPFYNNLVSSPFVKSEHARALFAQNVQYEKFAHIIVVTADGSFSLDFPSTVITTNVLNISEDDGHYMYERTYCYMNDTVQNDLSYMEL